jgi:hypothetical protein
MLAAVTFSFDSKGLFKFSFTRTPWDNQYASGKIFTLYLWAFSVSFTTLKPKINTQ